MSRQTSEPRRRVPVDLSTTASATSNMKRKHLSRHRQQPQSLFLRFRRFATRHTSTVPFILLLGFLGLYATNPTPSNPVHRFIFLSYRLPPSHVPSTTNQPAQYGKGPWDFAFVSFYMILLSFTREFTMQELLRPLALHFNIKSPAKQARFMEQMYTAIYFAVTAPAGLYVLSRTPVWFFNTRGMYETYPNKAHEGAFKFYYLFQAAYWAQQTLVMVLGLEKPRKDFRELVAHHVVTLSLIFLSYRCHFEYMGIAVYLTHDISDFFLATSKSLKYIDSPLADPYFGMFVFIWIYLRHYLNLRIIFSLFTEYKTVGPYELNWEREEYKGWLANVITLVLLVSLQVLNLYWLFCILRVIYGFARHGVTKDDRSDDDGEGEGGEEGQDKTD
ncbi:putative longevity assurance factor [Cercophora scortea]|uniref:Longevity assurance factor n=1 Tax=Cercophora scortea TaxID=314031 RepID=A0AAE0MF13_9PEZI|nr:putative longevity assurance factor [Cercophora scortea]